MDEEMKTMLSTIVKEIRDMKCDMVDMKDDMLDMKGDMQDIKAEMQGLKADVQKVERRVAGLELTMENVTNKNIQLLAENHMNLIDKLNQAVKVSDKTLLYEIQVETLKSKVDKLEKEIAEIRNHIA